MSLLHLGLVAVLWTVFAMSTVGKLRSPSAQRAFADSLRPLGFIPERRVAMVAAAVTSAELIVVLGLTWIGAGTLGGVPRTASVDLLSLVVTGALLCALTTGILVAIRRGTTARCACFGAADRVLGTHHLARNGILLAAVLGAVLTRPATPGAPTGALVAIAAGAVIATLLIRLDDLIDLFDLFDPDAGETNRPSQRLRRG